MCYFPFLAIHDVYACACIYTHVYIHMHKHMHMYTVVRSQSVNSSVTFRIRFFFPSLLTLTQSLARLPTYPLTRANYLRHVKMHVTHSAHSWFRAGAHRIHYGARQRGRLDPIGEYKDCSILYILIRKALLLNILLLHLQMKRQLLTHCFPTSCRQPMPARPVPTCWS